MNGYIHNEILFSFKRDENPDTCYKDELWEHYAKWNLPVTTGQILYKHLHEVH